MENTSDKAKPNWIQGVRLAVEEAIVRTNRQMALCSGFCPIKDTMMAETVVKIAQDAEEAGDPHGGALLYHARDAVRIIKTSKSYSERKAKLDALITRILGITSQTGQQVGVYQ